MAVQPKLGWRKIISWYALELAGGLFINKQIRKHWQLVGVRIIVGSGIVRWY